MQENTTQPKKGLKQGRNMKVSQVYFAKRKKPDSKGSHYMIPFIGHSGIGKILGTITDQ